MVNSKRFLKTIKNIYTGNEKLARMLIQNGADFTIKNEEGKTVGDIATEEGIFKRKTIFDPLEVLTHNNIYVHID